MRSYSHESTFNHNHKSYIIVLDFEANCSNDQVRDHEIIEFPALLIELKTGKTLSEFRTFVKMKHHLCISEFIKRLTHITDYDLRTGMTWIESLLAFENWCHKFNITPENTTIVCCGDWDLKTMLPRQMELHQTKFTPFLDELFSCWTNIKTSYRNVMKKTNRIGMAEMLDELGIILEGHHHSGIDDCRNIAKICMYLHNYKNVRVSEPNNFRTVELWYQTPRDLLYQRTKRGIIVKKK